MSEPKRCAFSSALTQDHMAHFWRPPAIPVADAQWTAAAPQDADEPGVFSCDGKLVEAGAP